MRNQAVREVFRGSLKSVSGAISLYHISNHFSIENKLYRVYNKETLLRVPLSDYLRDVIFISSSFFFIAVNAANGSFTSMTAVSIGQKPVLSRFLIASAMVL